MIKPSNEELHQAVKQFKDFYKELEQDAKKGIRDRSKPKKGSRTVVISVYEFKKGFANVSLRYQEEFIRMFGRVDTINIEVCMGNLKDACFVARELKTIINIPIQYIEYREEFDSEWI
jgi:hypothetical protein